MDDTRQPFRHRSERRPTLPFFPAALTLGISALLAVWPRVIPGLPRAPRLLLLAALLAATLIALARRRVGAHYRLRRPGVWPEPAAAPAPIAAVLASPAWLQIVSGPDAERLTRGVLEIASALIGRGERVLVVDGARRLRFHEPLRRDGAPGLLECLACVLPVFEAIQGGAEERLCLLPRGNPSRPEAWPQLGRLLAEVRMQFDRVVLALDFAVPAEAGQAFVGLEPAAWWCPDESASTLSAALTERIGIPLRNIELSKFVDVFHELQGQASDPGPGVAVTPPQSAPAPGSGTGGLGVRNVVPAVIVDCDLQVSERLRFLIWMRRVQAESQRELEAHH